MTGETRPGGSGPVSNWDGSYLVPLPLPLWTTHLLVIYTLRVNGLHPDSYHALDDRLSISDTYDGVHLIDWMYRSWESRTFTIISCVWSGCKDWSSNSSRIHLSCKNTIKDQFHQEIVEAVKLSKEHSKWVSMGSWGNCVCLCAPYEQASPELQLCWLASEGAQPAPTVKEAHA